MTIKDIQEVLLAVLPQWHYRVIKPFKQVLEDGMSLEMYYCIRELRFHQDLMTMSELARRAKMPKQQMTKLVNRLIECRFVERVDDPNDRRIVRLRLTPEAEQYTDGFLEKDAACFRDLLEQMEESDRKEFGEALFAIHRILGKLPCNKDCGDKEQE